MLQAVEQKHIRLSQLSSDIQGVLKDAFASRLYWVVAEISDHRYREDSDSHFFDLVEKDKTTGNLVAKLSCNAWRSVASRIRNFEEVTGQRFKTGLNVLMQLKVTYSPLYGLRLNLCDVDPAFTIGLMEQQKQETLQRLLSLCSEFIAKVDGRYVTRNSQLCINCVIQKIAVISSSSSAGLQDFIHTLETNQFNYRFSIDYYYTVVQGEANAELVHDRFLDIFHSKIAYDAVVLIRGGGAQTDFLLFDHFKLGRVVAKFPIPVITGIGHHKDETIVDLMANMCTKTPTKAAEMIVAHNRGFEEKILEAQKTIIIKSQQCITSCQKKLSSLNMQLVSRIRNTTVSHNDRLSCMQQNLGHLVKVRFLTERNRLSGLSCQITTVPETTIRRHTYELGTVSGNISLFSRLLLQKLDNRLEHFRAVTRLMDPANLVKKGFALVYYKGNITPAGKEIPLGAEITIRLPDASLTATVTAKNEPDGESDL